MSEREIVKYTETVAAEIASEYRGAPREELAVWVRLANQREAMVTELYDLSQIDARLERAPKSDAAMVIRSVIGSIWAHEESHTRFLSSLRSLSTSLPILTELQGKLEGRITASAVSDSGRLARFLIAVGASLKRVPAFAADLRRKNLRDLVHLYGELETTARLGYVRIIELCRQVEAIATGPADVGDFGFTFQFDIARILSEEKFHEETFRAMAGWINPDGETFIGTPAAECAALLRDLCERNLSVEAVGRVVDPSAVHTKGPSPDAPALLASDGGLGAFFADQGLSLPAVDSAPPLWLRPALTP